MNIRLLNDTETFPGVVRMTIRYWQWKQSPVAKEEAIRELSPPPWEPTTTASVIDTLHEVGVLERGESDRLRLHEAFASIDYRAQEADKMLRMALRTYLLGLEDRLIDTLAWLMHLDPMEDFGLSWRSADKRFRADVGDASETWRLNDVRWANFERWAVYLGFAWRHDGGLIPDPTEAIGDELMHGPLGGGKRVPVGVVLNDLSHRFPVVDGGSVFKRIAEETGHELPPNRLSATLSLALLSLEYQKMISLEHLSDAERSVQVVTSSSDAQKYRPITHIELSQDEDR